MDAPTTTSADSGTSSDDGGGDWFKPRKKPDTGLRQPPGQGSEPGQDRIPGPSRPVSAIRPVGTGASRPQPAHVFAPASDARPQRR